MNLECCEELLEEESEFSSIEETVSILVELCEVLVYLLFEVIRIILEISKGFDDTLKFFFCEFFSLNARHF